MAIRQYYDTHLVRDIHIQLEIIMLVIVSFSAQRVHGMWGITLVVV